MPMICPRCRKTEGKQVFMKAIKRKGGFHKNTKWECPDCGLVRMVPNE